MHKFVQHLNHGEGERGGGPAWRRSLYLSHTKAKGSPGFSEKFWIARMSALVRARGKNLFRNSFRMSSQVKIELGARE